MADQGTILPIWLRLHTSKVIAGFLNPLSRSHQWKTIYLVSPWISDFGEEAGMSYDQFLKRLTDDDATIYVVTRTPKEKDFWHTKAVEKLVQTTKANVVLVDSLHTKLFCAVTAQGEFALIGSANLTGNSLLNREIGVLITATGEGKELVRRLRVEASDIYRSPDRKIKCFRKLKKTE